jgi:hypothetical protein
MRRRIPHCPQCHTTRVVPIRYDDPTAEMVEAERRGEIVLASAGWPSGVGPTLHCLGCGYEWGGDPGRCPDVRSSLASSNAR